jgi:integrase
MADPSGETTRKASPTRRGFTRVERPRRLPTVLNEDEQEALLQQPNRHTGLRSLCLLRLMLNTGLRAAEVLNLKVNDIDWQNGNVMVREGKGKKDRTLWIGEADLKLLKN